MVALVNVGAPVRPAGPATSAATEMHRGSRLAAVTGPSGRAAAALIRELAAPGLTPDVTAAQPTAVPAVAIIPQPRAAVLSLPSGDRISLLACAWASPVAPGASRPDQADWGDLASLAGFGPNCALVLAVPAALAPTASLAGPLALVRAIGAQVLAVVVLTDSAQPADVAGQADPALAIELLTRQVSRGRPGPVAGIVVDLANGEGLPALRAALGGAASRLPVPDPGAPVRMWIESCCRMARSAPATCCRSRRRCGRCGCRPSTGTAPRSAPRRAPRGCGSGCPAREPPTRAGGRPSCSLAAGR